MSPVEAMAVAEVAVVVVVVVVVWVLSWVLHFKTVSFAKDETRELLFYSKT